jgi:hypothetical protein
MAVMRKSSRDFELMKINKESLDIFGEDMNMDHRICARSVVHMSIIITKFILKL